MILEYFRDRKSVGWFAGAALLVLVILAFIALYIPDFMGDPTQALYNQEVAWVDGDPIRASEFLGRYQQTSRQYQEQMGEAFTPAFARRMGLPLSVAGELAQRMLLIKEAERHGIKVTDAAVGEAIRTSPAFQQNGAFMGREAYLSLLAANRLTPRDFESSVREDLLVERLQAMVTGPADVPDAELLEEYRRRNESLSLDLWFLPASVHRGEVEVTSEEARERYESEPSAWEIPARRRVRFVTVSAQSLAEEVEVLQREIRRYYDRNLFRYQTDAVASASHILFLPESEEDEESVRAEALQVAERARSGADFAGLAAAFSNDSVTSGSGGSLGSFGPEELLPELAEAIFEMAPGEVSEPIRTSDGFHVVLLESLTPAETTELTDVEAEIEAILREEKAQELLASRIPEVSELARGADSLDEITARFPLMIPQESSLFTRGEPIPELGSADASDLAFDLEASGTAGPVRLANGFAFMDLIVEEPAHIPTFEDMDEQIREQIRSERALELAGAAAGELFSKLESGRTPDFDPTPLAAWRRGAPLGAAGIVPSEENRLFETAAGETLLPISTESGSAVVRVLERNGFSDEDFEAAKEAFRAELLRERRSLLWSSFVEAARDRHEVQIDEQALNELIG